MNITKYAPGTYPPGIVVAAGNRPPNASIPSTEPVVYDTIGSVTTAGVDHENGHAALRAFILGAQPGQMYSLLMEREDGKFDVCHRAGQPCIGSMRRYGHRSSRPFDYFPGDLRTPERTFPEGKPVMVAWPLQNYYGASKTASAEARKAFLKDFFLSSELSPWRQVLKDIEIIEDKDGLIKGIIICNTNVDPTLMISMLRNFRYSDGYAQKFYEFVQAHPKIDKRVAYLMVIAQLNNLTFPYTPPPAGVTFLYHGDLKNILNGTMIDGIHEGTFYERHAYNRPLVDYCFGYDPARAQQLNGTYQNYEELEAKILSFA